MASKKITKTKGKRSKSKDTPAVRYLRYEFTNSGTPGTETSHYLDLSRDLGIVNRRLYRQGRDYHVKKISIVSSNTIQGLYPGVAPGSVSSRSAGRISVACAPNSWVVKAAHRRAFKVWQQMNKDASSNLAGDIMGTWADFKVWLSNEMRVAGTTPYPLDNGGNAGLLDEWTYTQLVTPDGTTSADPFFMHLLGNHNGVVGAWNSVGLVKSYGESRATVQPGDPNVPSTAADDPLVNVFDYGTTVDEVVTLQQNDNDFPPYDVSTYPGDDLNMPKPLVVQDTTIVDGRATMGSFVAMCGLLEFEITSPIASDVYSVLVELAPGKYRGIKAEAI